MDFILEPRKGGGGRSGGGKSSKSSKSKSKSSKKYKGGGRVGGVGGGGAGGGGGGGFNTLPVWARVLIIVLIVWFIIFLIALTYYRTRTNSTRLEWQRKREGKKFRFGHALGNALLVSTGLWLPVFIYKKIAARRANNSGTYAKIEEGHGKEGAGNHDSWYGGAGAGVGNDTKYDPGNPPAYRPQTPNPPAPAPAPVPQTGAAADYYMPTPPSNTAPAQHPPQYA
ncbi:hypothetical protein CPLU01_05075 [Colletotrichum plurivorum]|uniref:Uncharacterized protein n=1 Tax=Colletotrichum plurivorum TaxID=2175906 RepID=A0A8H6KMG6_9PEZI|nr:hypothetical protein CPLU01_05075 [Colletotrichum plurivorum]